MAKLLAVVAAVATALGRIGLSDFGYEGGAATSASAEFSPLWFAVTFLTGSVFELYRNREEMTVI